MKYALGLDIGSVNVKLALMAEDGTAACLDEEKIVSNARAAVNALLSRLAGQFPLARIGHVGVTGSGKSGIPRELGWAEYSSALALASGLLQHHADARTIIQIGGQSSLVVTLSAGVAGRWRG